MAECMLDLETYGTKPGSVIRSIGVRVFTNDGMGKGFYRNIEEEYQAVSGATINSATVKWWTTPENYGEHLALQKDQQHVMHVSKALKDFFKLHNIEQVWCQGANFDTVLWEALCDMLGTSVPWKFYNVRDTRTAYDMADFDPKTVERVGTHHNALADADHQVRCLWNARNRIIITQKGTTMKLNFFGWKYAIVFAMISTALYSTACTSVSRVTYGNMQEVFITSVELAIDARVEGHISDVDWFSEVLPMIKLGDRTLDAIDEASKLGVDISLDLELMLDIIQALEPYLNRKL